MSEIKKVITIADRSTKSLVTAAAGLSKVAAELQSLAESSTHLSQEIEFKQSELDNLGSQFDSKFREQTAELRLRVLENEDKVLEGILRARGLVTITPVELDTLRRDLAQSQVSINESLTAAREEGRNEAVTELKIKLSSIEANHRIEIAELNANSKAKDRRIADLEMQVAGLNKQIDAERETRLAIAQAESARQGVVINTGKN